MPLAKKPRSGKEQQEVGHLQCASEPIMVRIPLNQAKDKDQFQPVARRADDLCYPDVSRGERI
ncbi:alpha-2-macroglobulin domain-containing protein [Anopheles sinensis]|uniref:Alpha-2-macroglobulin domain-containing protein n=1 Tax=Anopheles sinensis TaxID=74873 RepID=A0A084W7U3_ANOSI|nr:alpha-2-macroglobulin domain-containing protein [Anopheles sinensis]